MGEDKNGTCLKHVGGCNARYLGAVVGGVGVQAWGCSGLGRWDWDWEWEWDLDTGGALEPRS